MVSATSREAHLNPALGALLWLSNQIMAQLEFSWSDLAKLRDTQTSLCTKLICQAGSHRSLFLLNIQLFFPALTLLKSLLQLFFSPVSMIANVQHFHA